MFVPFERPGSHLVALLAHEGLDLLEVRLRKTGLVQTSSNDLAFPPSKESKVLRFLAKEPTVARTKLRSLAFPPPKGGKVVPIASIQTNEVAIEPSDLASPPPKVSKVLRFLAKEPTVARTKLRSLAFPPPKGGKVVQTVSIQTNGVVIEPSDLAFPPPKGGKRLRARPTNTKVVRLRSEVVPSKRGSFDFLWRRAGKLVVFVQDNVACVRMNPFDLASLWRREGNVHVFRGTTRRSARRTLGGSLTIRRPNERACLWWRCDRGLFASKRPTLRSFGGGSANGLRLRRSSRPSKGSFRRSCSRNRRRVRYPLD